MPKNYGEGWHKPSKTPPDSDAATVVAVVRRLLRAPVVIAARRIQKMRLRHVALDALVVVDLCAVLDSSVHSRKSPDCAIELPRPRSSLAAILTAAPNSPNRSVLITPARFSASGRRLPA